MIKYLKIFFVFLLIGILGFFLFYFIRKDKATISTDQIKRKKIFSISPAPKESIVGTIASASGQILWQSRVADEPEATKEIKKIRQAELLATGKDGQATVVFSDDLNIKLDKESEIEFLQTLPLNFVFRQNKGEILYEKTGDIPLSVRSFHLLISIENGIVLISTDEKNHEIIILAKSAKAKIAYNDINYQTQIIKLNEGEKFTFNDDSRIGDLTLID